MRGVTFGEYQCDKDDDLAMIAAQQYYVDYGVDIRMDQLCILLPNYIPSHSLSRSGNTIEQWAEQIAGALRKVTYQLITIHLYNGKLFLTNIDSNKIWFTIRFSYRVVLISLTVN